MQDHEFRYLLLLLRKILTRHAVNVIRTLKYCTHVNCSRESAYSIAHLGN
jgi:hypothetical protein